MMRSLFAFTGMEMILFCLWEIRKRFATMTRLDVFVFPLISLIQFNQTVFGTFRDPINDPQRKTSERPFYAVVLTHLLMFVHYQLNWCSFAICFLHVIVWIAENPFNLPTFVWPEAQSRWMCSVFFSLHNCYLWTQRNGWHEPNFCLNRKLWTSKNIYNTRNAETNERAECGIYVSMKVHPNGLL